MSLLRALSHWFRGIFSSAPEPASRALDPEKFIYLKLPGNIQPVERGELFEDRIDPVLQERNLGSVTGGGSSLSAPRPDGTSEIEFCGIDIDVTDLEATLDVLRELLPRLKVPLGTELHYTAAGAKLQDQFGASGWQVRQVRTFMHPGFGV